jgi:exodeoxyribonuclease VII small subunit
VSEAKAEAAKIAKMSFEDAMAALEQIVERLESGEAPLEESIALYERGEALRKHCETKLKDAELRVEKIVQGADGQAAGTEPFATE